MLRRAWTFCRTEFLRGFHHQDEVTATRAACGALLTTVRRNRGYRGRLAQLYAKAQRARFRLFVNSKVR